MAPGRGRRGGLGAGGAARLGGHGLALLLALGADAQDQARDLVLDRLVELAEELEALLLVLHLRVDLAVAAQADAGLERVDRLEVVLPARVDGVQEHVLLDAAHELVADLALARDVELLDGLQRRLGRAAVLGHRHGVPVGQLEPEGAPHPAVEGLGVLGADARRALDGALDHHQDLLLQLDRLEHVLARAVDLLALLVHHLVVLEEALADLEVAVLDLLLGLGDGARDHARLDLLALGHAELLHRAGDPVAVEDPHQVVFQREEEAREARVALAAGAAAQLVVDAPRLMALGAEHVEPAELEHLLLVGGAARAHLFADRVDLLELVLVALLQAGGLEGQTQAVLEVAAQLDVGAAAGHVGGHGHDAALAGASDDVRLALPVADLGVEHAVLDLALGEQVREVLGLLDRGRADQDRLALLVQALDLVRDRLPLLAHGAVDEVVGVVPREGHVGRDRDHVQVIDLVELARLGQGRAGHARELLEHAEVVLVGDRGQGLVLLARSQALLDLDRLVQTVRPAPAGHLATGELVDDDDLGAVLPVLDHVLLVEGVDRVGAQGVLDEVRPVLVAGRVEGVDADHLLGLDDARLQQVGGLLLLLDLVVLLGGQGAGDLVGQLVLVAALLGGPRDDQGGARLVDQDRVDLVDDRVVEVLLDLLLHARLHVVAQVVEAELVVRAIDDVHGVDRLPLPGAHVGLDRADGHPQVLEDGRHPGRVAPGQVVVDRDQVAGVARQGVEVERQGRDQGLALARHHLGDGAVVQDDAAHQLHVVVAQAQGALGGLAHQGEGLGQDVIELLLARLHELAQLVGLLQAVLVGEALGPALEVVHRLHQGVQGLYGPLVAGAEDALEEATGLVADAAELV